MTAAKISANFPGAKPAGGAAEATCPLPEVSMVKVTDPVCVTEDGLKVALEFCGKAPLRLNVTVPTGGLVTKLAVNVYAAGLPALTVTAVGPTGTIDTAGVMLVTSEAELLLGLASPIPATCVKFVTEVGAFCATLTVSVIAG